MERNDTQLAERLKSRDADTLRVIIRHYSGYVMAVVSHTLPGYTRREDREELVSDVFVALWNNVPKLKPQASLKPWLAVAARNKALNWARARARRVAEVPLDAIDDESFYAHRTDNEGTDNDEASGFLHALLESLDERSRDVLTRHYYLQQSVREIAQDTGQTESSVKTRLHRGRRGLRARLGEKGASL
jgi:RNA polymerase sigma-70 factor (ECF subfamily)